MEREPSAVGSEPGETHVEGVCQLRRKTNRTKYRSFSLSISVHEMSNCFKWNCFRSDGITEDERIEKARSQLIDQELQK